MVGISRTSAESANLAILQTANAQFEKARKRTATGRAVETATDDVARYRISSIQLGRARQLDQINNNISLALKTIEATSQTLNQMIRQVELAQDLARDAQEEGMASLYGIYSSQDIASSSVIGGVSAGRRLSITSDNGKNFIYIAEGTTDTWGEVVDQLNRAAIGVRADFIPSETAGQTNIRFYALDGRDFTFDGISDQSFMENLASAPWVSNGNGQPMTNVAQAQALFGTGGVTANGERGFTVTYGGNIVGTKAVNLLTTIDPGSTLVLSDSTGSKRSFSYLGVNQLWQVMNDINNSGLKIRAEFTNQTSTGANEQLRLRSTDGGEFNIESASDDFLAGGSIGLVNTSDGMLARPAPLRADTAIKLSIGVAYDQAVQNLDALVRNNPTAQGRNLLIGQNIGVLMDEFTTNPLLVSGLNITAAGTLSLTQSGLGWVQFNTIQTSALQANQALLTLRDFQAKIGTFASYLKERYELGEQSAKALRELGNDIVSADMAAESAAMTALQTRQQFAVQAMSMGSTTDSGLLRLLG